MNLWVVVNLVAPVAVPIVGALVVAPFVYTAGAADRRGHPLGAFKDGQLCWVVMGMCFNAFYELVVPAKDVKIPADFSVNMGVALLCVLVPSIGIAILGSAMPVAWPVPSPTPLGPKAALWKFIVDYPIFIASVIMTVAIIWIAWTVHLTTQG